MTGRVLAVDAAAKKMKLTLKPGLLTSKLPMIVSPQQAVPGTKAHAVVTGVKVWALWASRAAWASDQLGACA